MIILGSPLLTTAGGIPPSTQLGRTATAPPATRIGALKALLVLLALALMPMLILVGIYYPDIARGDEDTAIALREIGLAAGAVAIPLPIVCRFRQDWSPLLGPIGCLAGGVLCSGLALHLEYRFPGLALQALLLSIIVFAIISTGYWSGKLRLSDRMRSLLYVATMAIAIVVIVSITLRIFSYKVPIIHNAGWGGLIWTAAVAIIASLNFLVVFSAIDRIELHPAPKHMEWYAAFAAVITFVWLYITILRLIAHIRLIR